MATYTENYNLLVTEAEDNFDIADYNGNFETLDNILAENETAMETVSAKIGNADDTDDNTVFGKLNSGGQSFIKSIQHVTYVTNGTKTRTVEINPVDSSKCFVILERLKDVNAINHISYELTDSSIEITHASTANNDAMHFGFWIIEFN